VRVPANSKLESMKGILHANCLRYKKKSFLLKNNELNDIDKGSNKENFPNATYSSHYHHHWHICFIIGEDTWHIGFIMGKYACSICFVTREVTWHTCFIMGKNTCISL